MSKKNTIEVLLAVIPLTGKKQKKEIRVAAKALVRQVLEAGGVDAKKKDITVDGKPATLDTKVSAGSKVEVAERPQGS